MIGNDIQPSSCKPFSTAVGEPSLLIKVYRYGLKSHLPAAFNDPVHLYAKRGKKNPRSKPFILEGQKSVVYV